MYAKNTFEFVSTYVVSLAALWQSLTAGCPCCLMSIWAKEQVSPTPITSTVKFLKKSMISKDFLLRQKMRMMGVTTGLNSSSRINTCRNTNGKLQTETSKFLLAVEIFKDEFCLTSMLLVWSIQVCVYTANEKRQQQWSIRLNCYCPTIWEGLWDYL